MSRDLPVGVCLTSYQTPQDRKRGTWRKCYVGYYGHGRGYKSKRFTVAKYGDQGARAAAILWRWSHAPISRRSCDIARRGLYRPRNLAGHFLPSK
jgi:hypothetical protein